MNHLKTVYIVNDLCADESEAKRVVEKWFNGKVSYGKLLFIDSDYGLEGLFEVTDRQSGYVILSDVLFPLEEVSQVTLQDLIDGTRRFDREEGRKADRVSSGREVNIYDPVIIPYLGAKMLFVRAITRSAKAEERDPTSKYTTVLVLYGVTFSEEPVRGWVRFFDERLDKMIWIKPVRPSEVRVSVRCTCWDFRYVFADIIASKGALYGPKFKAYDWEEEQRKKLKKDLETKYGRRFLGRLPKDIQAELDMLLQLKRKEREERPRKLRAKSPYPGACKHIFALVFSLKDNGIIVL